MGSRRGRRPGGRSSTSRRSPGRRERPRITDDCPGGDTMRLADQVAVITGGGSGIGRGIVLCMAREGADIAIPDINEANAQGVATEVGALGRGALALHCDVPRTADVEASLDRIKGELGRIDILVNN